MVPIVPRLREILADAFDAAAPGEQIVVPMAARPTANLRTTAEKVIERAGVEPWPRLFQNLRASCETDWVQKYPAHVAAKWLGHSPTIAAQHYLQVRDAHFQDAIGGGECAALAGGPSGGAESGARTAHFEAQQASAPFRSRSHQNTETATTPGVITVSARDTDNCTNEQVGSTGFEPPQFSPGETAIDAGGGAESGAPGASSGADPLLALVAGAWPRLTAEQRLRIVEIAAAAAPAPTLDIAPGVSPRPGRGARRSLCDK
jgi:hypothetical protein